MTGGGAIFACYHAVSAGLAAAAGIEQGDIIKKVSRNPARDPEDFYAALAHRKQGQAVLLLIKRGANSIYLLL